MSILFLNTLTLLAPTQSADNLFHSFTVLCENENFLISSLHCFFANVTPCPLVLLSSLTVKKIFLSIFGIILVAPLCTLSSISISFLRYGLHACIQYSKWGLTIVLWVFLTETILRSHVFIHKCLPSGRRYVSPFDCVDLFVLPVGREQNILQKSVSRNQGKVVFTSRHARSRWPDNAGSCLLALSKIK